VRRFPKSLDPTAAGDPLAGLSFSDTLFNLSEEILERICALEIQSHLALADSENVAMRIRQTGHHCFAGKIDNFFGSKFFRLVIRANENNVITINRDCFGVRLFFVNGVNVTVNENGIGRFRGGGDAAHEQQNSSDNSHHRTVSVIPRENANPGRKLPVWLE
jgi:hypothetical protein